MIGAELRHARENAGLSQAELGEPLFVSGSFIGQLEAGTRRLHLEYAVQIDEILDTNGFFERNCTALAKSKYPDHFAEAAEAEAIATAIREYATLLIPGLLQTRGYAEAVFRAFVEGPDMGKLLDDPATVARHTLTFNLLQAAALSPQDSLALIESVAQDYEHGEQHP
jgi:transcriptional regulator with XRE-family HTH domain